MAVTIRLRREGRRNRPFFRVVVTDSRHPRDGRFIEQVGHYDPTTEPSIIKLESERIEYWMGKGAKPSDTVRNLIKRSAAAATAPAPATAEATPAAPAPSA